MDPGDNWAEEEPSLYDSTPPTSPPPPAPPNGPVIVVYYYYLLVGFIIDDMFYPFPNDGGNNNNNNENNENENVNMDVEGPPHADPEPNLVNNEQPPNPRVTFPCPDERSVHQLDADLSSDEYKQLLTAMIRQLLLESGGNFGADIIRILTGIIEHQVLVRLVNNNGSRFFSSVVYQIVIDTIRGYYRDAFPLNVNLDSFSVQNFVRSWSDQGQNS